MLFIQGEQEGFFKLLKTTPRDKSFCYKFVCLTPTPNRCTSLSVVSKTVIICGFSFHWTAPSYRDFSLTRLVFSFVKSTNNILYCFLFTSNWLHHFFSRSYLLLYINTFLSYFHDEIVCVVRLKFSVFGCIYSIYTRKIKVENNPKRFFVYYIG